MTKTNTMDFIESPIKKMSAKAARKYQVREAFKGMSFLGVVWAVFAYVYTTFELGILRTFTILVITVWLLDNLVPFWKDLVDSILTSLF